MSNAKFQTGAALLDGWEHDLWHGEPPERWPLGIGPLARDLDFGPGEVLLIGGAPGAGKTALATAAVFDALRAVPELRALIVNVEMSPGALLNRQLSRLSGIQLETIQARDVRKLVEAGQARIRDGMDKLRVLLSRVAFLEPPFTLDHVAKAADEFGADCILLDYIQRISPPGDQGSQRENIEASMTRIREWALKGVGVIVLSAVSRQSGNGGSNYDGLGLASFRGSSELEFAADSAYVLSESKDKGENVTLRCCKRRNGEPKHIELRFERAYQRFVPVGYNPVALAPAIEGTYDDDEAPF